MEHTPFKITMKSLQLVPDFIVVYYDETNYPIERHFFTSRDAADSYFDAAIHLFDAYGANDYRKVKVRYIQLLFIDCTDDVYQYFSAEFHRVKYY